MAFPSGWGRKCALTIDYTKLSGDVVNFPVLLTVANLPSEMFDADGSYPARADGGDIRCSTDAAGTTQIPVEVYYFLRDNNPANGKTEIHVKLPSISSSVNTVFYIWYNAPSETMPAASSTYGSQNVWDANFKFVSHMGATFNDSTSNGLTGTNHSTTEDTSITKIGVSTRKFVSASSQYIDYGDVLKINGDVDITVEGWVYYNGDPSWQEMFGKGDTQWGIGENTNSLNFNIYDTTWQAVVLVDPATLTWYNAGGTRAASDNLLRGFLNGAATGLTLTTTTIRNGSDSVYAGANSGASGRYLNGNIEELRVSDTRRLSAWFKATYNSINSPATFLTAGTPGPGSATVYGFGPFFAEV